MRSLLCLSILAMLACPAPASAQAGEKKNALEAIKMLKCSFPVSASGTWKDWTPNAAIQPGPELTLVIDEIDIDGGTARIGTTHSTALLTQNSVHFMERTMAGSLTMIGALGWAVVLLLARREVDERGLPDPAGHVSPASAPRPGRGSRPAG